jgi:putative transposase
MPNHLHMLVTAEDSEPCSTMTGTRVNRFNGISIFMGRLKEYTAKEIINFCIRNKQTNLLTVFLTAAAESKQNHKYQVWQKRFHNIAITGNAELLTRLNYIHTNPLQEKWGLCESTEEYQYSSARYYISGEDVGIPIVEIA